MADHDPSVPIGRSAGAGTSDAGASGGGALGEGAALDRELRGDLPCLVCRYNLRGITIRGSCPECGTAVRATLLARVDPHAPVLRPLRRPRLTAAGLVVWSAAGFLAALATWGVRGRDAILEMAEPGPAMAESLGRVGQALGVASVALIALAAVAALVLVKPHGGIPRWQSLAAAGGVVLLAMVAATQAAIHLGFDPRHVRPYFSAETPLLDRTLWRLAQAGALAGALVLLRPNARLLAARSLLMRMGRVDRQTMLSMVAAVGVIVLGDALHLGAALVGPEGPGYLMAPAGTLLIAVGSVLLTVGLAGMVIDSVRLAPVLVRRAVSLGELLEGDGRDAPGRSGR